MDPQYRTQPNITASRKKRESGRTTQGGVYKKKGTKRKVKLTESTPDTKKTTIVKRRKGKVIERTKTRKNKRRIKQLGPTK